MNHKNYRKTFRRRECAFSPTEKGKSMKIKLLLLGSLSLFCSVLIGNTYEIKQDGSGDYLTIQDGIIASTHNDTILVYPGIYYENINYLEKSITVASLYAITQADSIINQTIIDGNNNGKCVIIDECVNASLIGFTIQNGKCNENTGTSSSGAGVYIYFSEDIIISNNIITNNIANAGGGICLGLSSTVDLSENLIYHNQASAGGGIFISGNDYSDVNFDAENLNSVYSNFANTGTDIYIHHYTVQDDYHTYDIVLDTFTIQNPINYFIAYEYDYNFTCENYIFDEIDADLYVATDGDNENSGLNQDEPLQTIAYALALIKSNSASPNTIHLAPGTYSVSNNNQLFPIGIKDNVDIVGDTAENTILDGEHEHNLLYYRLHKDDFLPKTCLENVTLKRSTHIDKSYGAIFFLKAELFLKNVIVDESYGTTSSGIICKDGIYDFENVLIKNSRGGKPFRFMCVHADNPDAFMNISLKNFTIENSLPLNGEFQGDGGAFAIGGHYVIDNNFYAKMVNCNINNNLDDFYYNGVGGTSGLNVNNHMKLDAVNCTFADNNLGYYTGATITVRNSELNLYNSILYGNDGYSINLWSNSEVNVYNSLIEGGVYNMHQYETPSEINWMEGNLGEFADPYFIGEDTDYPFYSLESTSPCINAGTLNLPEGIELPEYDLAGNPRIYGNTIDMGAYEFQGDPQSNDENEIIIPEITKISNYPNPFNPSTTIKLDLAESGKIDFSIYNVKGQKVKTLIDAYSSNGIFEFVWDGKDTNKKQVSSGTYFMKLTVDGVEKAVEKCTLLK